MAKKDQSIFEVQVNLVYRLHARDKLEALAKILRPLELLNPPGGVSRMVKWSDVKDPVCLVADGYHTEKASDPRD